MSEDNIKIKSTLWKIVENLIKVAEKEEITSQDFIKVKVYNTALTATHQLVNLVRNDAYLEKLKVIREKLTYMFPGLPSFPGEIKKD